MRFRVTHHTIYHYRQPASESVAELRVCPQTDTTQRVLSQKTEVEPEVKLGSFSDHWGNRVEYFSIPYRHDKLVVRAVAEVETFPLADLSAYEQVTFAEARQIMVPRTLDFFDFRRASQRVPTGRALRGIREHFAAPERPVMDTLLAVNGWIYKHFKYVPGATDVGTPVAEVIRSRRGVCQDFAHLMLAIVRTIGIPARYVSGYIESNQPDKPDKALIGAAASHAWIEAALPGDVWVGFDPTNNQMAGERHVKVAVGRDYEDVAPVKGTFKGADDQKLQVMVSVTRE